LTLVSAPRFEVLADFRGVIERLGITHLGIVPSMLEATLPEGPQGLPLKYVVSGGEKISDGLIKKWSGPEGVLLANFYGFGSSRLSLLWLTNS
jgi:acyl-coenzyme A synthetase/AMP-(fatty) acid ligase